MKRGIILGFIALLALDTLAQIGFKLSALHAGEARFDAAWFLATVSQPWAIAVVIGYLGAFGVYMTLIKHAPIGPAFAASHLEIVVVILVSLLFLGESLSLLQALGCLAIIAGVVVLAATEEPEEQP